MFIITYISYHEFRDWEKYSDKETAEKRYEQLKNCKNVSKLELREA